MSYNEEQAIAYFRENGASSLGLTIMEDGLLYWMELNWGELLLATETTPPANYHMYTDADAGTKFNANI